MGVGVRVGSGERRVGCSLDVVSPSLTLSG